MLTHFPVVTRSVFLAGFLVLQFALVALAADDSPATKVPKAQAGTQKVRAFLRVHVTQPKNWPAGDSKPNLEEFESYKRNLAAMVKGTVVVNTALDDKSVQDLPLIKQHGANAADWLSAQLEVEFPGNGELMIIGISADDRDQARKIVDAVINAFLRVFVDRERTDKLVLRDNLQKKYLSLKQGVLNKERQLIELEDQLGVRQKDVAGRTKRQIPLLEQLVLESRRAEIQAELQVARAKHKLEGLADSSVESKATKAEVELAEVDRKFWNSKSTALAEEIDKIEEQLAKKERFNADADQIRKDIEQQQVVIRDMANTLAKWNIEMDAAERVEVLESAR